MNYIIKIIATLPLFNSYSINAMEMLKEQSWHTKQYKEELKKYENYSQFINQEKEEARLQGEQHKAQDIALKMLAKGMSEADIMDCTGLTTEQIQDLKK